MTKIYLHCRYGESSFFLPGEAVRGLTTAPKITPMPSLKNSALLGITPLEGEAPPVFSAVLFFDCQSRVVLEPEVVIFLDLKGGAVGLAVSEVVGNVMETELREAADENHLIVEASQAKEKFEDYIQRLRSPGERERSKP